MKRALFLMAGSVLLAVAAFFAARAAFESTQATSATLQAKAAAAVSRASAELESSLAATRAAEDDPFAARARFLAFVDGADATELRRLYLSPLTTRREKRSIAQRWAELDPKSLFEHLKGLSRTEWERDTDQNDTVRGILFRTWAESDADAALAAADSLKFRPQFRGAPWEIVNALFAVDPARGFAAAATLPAQSEGDRLVDSTWKDNPSRLLEAAGAAPIASLKNAAVFKAVTSAFAKLVEKNPAAAADWLAGRTGEQRRKLWPTLARSLAEKDVPTARNWIEKAPPSPEREAAGAAVVEAWAKQDPRAALEWLQDNLQGGRPQAFAGVAAALAGKGIDAAKQLLDAMPPGSSRDAVVAVIASRWAEKDIKSAAAWVTSLPEGDAGRRQAFQQMSWQWAEKDLDSAAAFAIANTDTEEGDQMFWNVNQKIVQKGLPETMAWAEKLPEERRTQVYGDLFGSSFHNGKLPEIFASAENLPPSQRESLLRHGVSQLLRSTYSSSGGATKLGATGLQHVPPGLRAEVRQLVEADAHASPDQKAAALKALGP